ncbi:unnamed protein product [Enterobius vermicularis]|uniref:G_PROTEIN_RECEP_F1_2 domain-containing protein n=1 Tax=Enterobius vermicularis TaxID=51028 RepID=A0A3P6HUS6_ENTVE|nr:unnamed protein product [Enterobius vermicularis]
MLSFCVSGTPSYLSESPYSWRTILIFWIPDGLWLVFPLAVMICLWPKIVNLAYYVECPARDVI